MDQTMSGRDDPKPVDERESGKGELQTVEEEAGREKETVDQHEADRLEEEVVRVEMEAKPQENAAAKGVGVGVSLEELQKSVEGISDNGLVNEVATLAQEVSPAVERLVISDVVSLELMKNADTFSPILDDKKLLPAVSDGELGKVETQAVSVDEGKSFDAPTSAASSNVAGSVENGDSHVHSYDNLGVTVREADSGKNHLKLETQKQSEQQALIGVNHPPLRRTSWIGCCGLFEVFKGADR